MADKKRKFSFTNLFRRSTPKPADRTVFNMGIQERENTHMMTGPLLYNIMNQSVIGRTCTTQLKQEVFRRGYVWEKAYEARCKECGKKHTRPVQECSRCQSTDLQFPDVKQLEYAELLKIVRTIIYFNNFILLLLIS